MLRNLQKVLAAVMVASVFVGAMPTEAKSLRETKSVRNHTATIVAEDISQKGHVETFDLSGIDTIEGAEKWIRDNVSGKNFRFVSTDPELLKGWKKATVRQGYEVKNPENNYRKVHQITLIQLKRGDNVSFEIKNKYERNEDLQKLGVGVGILGTVVAFVK